MSHIVDLSKIDDDELSRCGVAE